MRTKAMVVPTVITLGLLTAGCSVWRYIKGSTDEEAPIIVKNGSMDVLAGSSSPNNRYWKWNRRAGTGNPVFIHDPAGNYGNNEPGQLFVYVVGKPVNGCTMQTAGDTVTVTFNDGFSIKISRAQVGSSFQYRTHVEASASTGLAEVSGAKRPTLRHGASGSGFIASVTVGGDKPCTFPSEAALTRICVSPNDPKKDCDE